VPAPEPALPVSDPLSEAPDMVWYVRPPSGGQYGPAPAPTMRLWIEEGRVPPDSLVWREGWRDWQQASATFPQLRTDNPLDQLTAIAAGRVAPSRAPVRDRQDGPRDRSHSRQTVLIVGLILAVVLLFAIFLWVLLNGPRLVSMNRVVALPAVVVSSTAVLPQS
jgi:hypothetical protein